MLDPRQRIQGARDEHPKNLGIAMMTRSEKTDVLAHARAFSRMPPTELAVLAEIMREETFEAGAIVTLGGEVADRVYVVTKGELAVDLPAGGSRALRPGDILGEYGVVAGSVRTATVRAETPAVLLSLEYERFVAYLHRFPEALWVLFESAVRRLVEAERRVGT